MKIKAETDELYRVLRPFKQIVPSGGSDLDTVRLEAKEGGLVEMSGTDMDTALRLTFGAEVLEPGTAFVTDLKWALEFLDQISEDSVTFERIEYDSAPEQEGVAWHLESGTIRRVSTSDHWFPSLVEPVEELHEVPGLPGACDLVLEYVPDNDIRQYIRGVHLHRDGFLEATDGHRAIRAPIDVPEPLEGAWLPREAAELLTELPEWYSDYTARVGQDGGRRTVEFGDWQTSIGHTDKTRRDYPDLEKIIEMEGAPEAVISGSPSELNRAFGLIEACTDDRTSACTIKVEGGQATVSVEDRGAGEAEIELPCEAEGSIEVGFNAGYIRQAMMDMKLISNRARFELNDVMAPAFIESENGSWEGKIVVMPVRA